METASYRVALPGNGLGNSSLSFCLLRITTLNHNCYNVEFPPIEK